MMPDPVSPATGASGNNRQPNASDQQAKQQQHPTTLPAPPSHVQQLPSAGLCLLLAHFVAGSASFSHRCSVLLDRPIIFNASNHTYQHSRLCHLSSPLHLQLASPSLLRLLLPLWLSAWEQLGTPNLSSQACSQQVLCLMQP